jgi:hypothetical protein
MQKVLLSTAYLPNTEYFHYLLKDNSIIEKHEHYQKQSFRNRCQILSANGVLDLVIPLKKNADKELISQKRISYSENWQTKHWRAISSAYKNSPYFEFFEPEFYPFYAEKHEFLFDYNLKLIETILKILRIKKELALTNEFQKEFQGLDLRESIHPKVKSAAALRPYHQVFADRFGYTENLSVIDLLFNQGLNTKDFLTL